FFPDLNCMQASLVEFCLPGDSPVAAGVIVIDPESGDYRLRFRRDWQTVAGEEAEVLSLLADDFHSKLQEFGAVAWLERCEDTLSNTIRISNRENVDADNLDGALDRLYRRRVQPNVLPFRTHLPFYSARVAAGKFLDDNEVEAEDWIEGPDGLRLEPDM